MWRVREGGGERGRGWRKGSFKGREEWVTESFVNGERSVLGVRRGREELGVEKRALKGQRSGRALLWLKEGSRGLWRGDGGCRRSQFLKYACPGRGTPAGVLSHHGLQGDESGRGVSFPTQPRRRRHRRSPGACYTRHGSLTCFHAAFQLLRKSEKKRLEN